jgi:peptide chain release factor 1
MDLLKRLGDIVARRQEVEKALADPEVVNDMERFRKLSKEYSDLEPLENQYYAYKRLLDSITNNRSILANDNDQELRDMAKEELEELESQKGPMEEKIKQMLVPEDPEDSKNAIVEIRAGTGGDEASLFAGDLFRLYQRYIDRQSSLQIEILNSTEGATGGFKEIIFNVKGDHAYGTLKYESGVHRVQRVPETESQGRVHTSAASVAVLPEVEDIDVEINDSEIRRDVFCASGPGGQSVNTTYSAVRLTHEPTGIAAMCQDEKSQWKNHEKAMRVLRSRLYEIERQKQQEKIDSQRRSMVSTGDRSAKIRTYNFPQSRVTDHRINLNLHNLQGVMDGEIDELIDKLKVAENAEKLKEGAEEDSEQ